MTPEIPEIDVGARNILLSYQVQWVPDSVTDIMTRFSVLIYTSEFDFPGS